MLALSQHAKSWQLDLLLFSVWEPQFGFSVLSVPAFPSWFSTTCLRIVVDVMTSGPPQVCKLWLGVSKGMLLVKHLAPKIFKIMAVNNCGCHLARTLGWAAPAYHINEDAIPHSGACKFILQYDGRPDEHFGVRVGMWNLSSLSGKGGDVCEEFRKRMSDVCYLQVV